MIVRQQAAPANSLPEWQAVRLLHRGVVDARRAAVLGAVADVVFDLQRQELAGLLIGPAGAAGSLLDAVRSMFGGAPFGQRLVEAQHIVALTRDVVVVDDRGDDHGADHARRRQASPTAAHAHLPRLTQLQSLAVVTIAGQRIGRLADVLLDREGRVITGYLVDTAPPAARPQHPAPASHEPQSQEPTHHAHQASQARQDAARQEAARPHGADADADTAGALFMIAATTPLRLGRDVIVVGDLGRHGRPLAAPDARVPAARNAPPNAPAVADAPNEYPPRWPASEADAAAMPGAMPATPPWPPQERGDDAWPDAPTQT